ncbi:ABC transporter ATP-binding protein [Acetobacterium wieringae]|uniref:Putative HMP/thiamine import ATP-binding protein YkoD n=1 Tax=Acetobacterium wieringae TaxID=52694 RepID=A0A1F2PNQ7_9FIRM|nr:ABC transporter ATP-binding protein [Acetobacterium wieringae]OFV72371.1 putative HMP/thiamine import ATP-binding protein YkoD [Acetobacterium wieringae]URN84759.1 ATP-binding cassette domain-containing protein [Acetobacterium wieringae]
MKPIIQLDITALTFPDEPEPALKNIKLNINAGEFIAITGGAASGKSLLLHTITSAAPKFYPCAINGTVTVADQNVSKLPLCQMADYLGYMMQEPQNQMVNRRVTDELAFGVANLNLSQDEIEHRVNVVMDFLGIRAFSDRTTDALSGGQAQKVVLGSILAMKTPILLLDQPTAELDPKTSSELYRHLGRLNREKKVTTLVVMDKSGAVLKDAHRVLVMEAGTVKDFLTVSEYHKKYGCRKNNRRAKPFQVDERYDVIKLSGASHTYKGGITGCQPLDFSLKKGDFTAIIGQNGSGKSTMLKLIEGLVKPSAGSVELFGTPVTRKNVGELRRRVGFLFQNPDDQIFCSSVRDEISYVLKNKNLSAQQSEQKIQETLDLIGLAGLEEMHPQRLSRGQRQLLALGSVVINDPELIIADEPTSGLNAAQSQVVMEKLAHLSGQGVTILLVTHDLAEARDFANRIVVMHNHQLALEFEAPKMDNYLNDLVRLELIEGGDF